VGRVGLLVLGLVTFTFTFTFMLVACGPPPRKHVAGKPARPATEPKETLPAGEACERDQDLRRFGDPSHRVSFCAPALAKVGWQAVVLEANTIEEMWFAADTSCNFSVVIWKKTPLSGTEPIHPVVGAKLEVDEPSGSLAGKKAHHYRMTWHEHHDRSSTRDEHGNHSHEEASDHDVALERWSVLLSNGAMLTLTMRTQENTSDSQLALYRRMASTFRFDDASL